MRRAWILVALPLLAGCPSLGMRVPETVQVPVPVPCAAKKPAKPKLITDPELRSLDSYSATIHLLLDRLVRGQYEAQLEAALAGCWQPDEGKPGGT